MQLEYSTDVAPGYHGMVADSAPSLTDTVVTAAEYDVGIVLVADRSAGAGAKRAKAPAAAAELDAVNVIGFLSRNEMSEPGKVPAGSVRAAVRKGRVFVNVEAAVTKYATAFVRHAAGSGSTLGALRGDDDTGTATAVPGITFLQDTAGPGLCKVEFDL